MRIKICGICSARDANISVDSGADALGFLCGVPSSVRSHITPRKAQEIIASLPPFISTVLVTTIGEPKVVDGLLRRVPVTHLQLHGPIERQAVLWLKRKHPSLKVIKTIHVTDRTSIDEARRWQRITDALLMDTKSAGSLGGTGKTHDWRISRAIVRAVSIPVILAGGLSPENVRRAILEVKPYGVDVNSGVSSGGRRKNRARLELFIRRAR
jgi:phosphoribosylanthranilate isomerase